MTASQMPTEPSASSSSVEIQYVPPHEITTDLCGVVVPCLLPAALRSGEMDKTGLLLALGSGRLSLFLARQREDGMIVGAVACRIARHDNGRRVYVIQYAGSVGTRRRRISISEMRATAEVLTGWAVRMGCDAVQIYARRGWAKVLPGFTEKSVLLERGL